MVLTDRARSVLEVNRDRDRDTGQAFHAGLKRERELEYDAQIYRAYEHEAARLEARGLEIERVRLDYELKRKYQQWLHERDRDRPDADGRPDRDGREIERWAHDYDLPYFYEQVHFPDCRIEYRDIDGREDHVDVEVTTEHYRGAHGAAVARSGFSCHCGSSARIDGRGGGGGRGVGLPTEIPEARPARAPPLPLDARARHVRDDATTLDPCQSAVWPSESGPPEVRPVPVHTPSRRRKALLVPCGSDNPRCVEGRCVPWDRQRASPPAPGGAGVREGLFR